MNPDKLIVFNLPLRALIGGWIIVVVI